MDQEKIQGRHPHKETHLKHEIRLRHSNEFYLEHNN